MGVIARYSVPDWGGHSYVRLFHEFNTYNHTEGQMLIIGVNFLL